ncbi:MAG: proline iminopeptidase-family hydrolase [Erythrobacter sp.]|jgi:proline iminopeptidase/L-proline amide hydrolase|nr:proline iminopeptidase-family hydrolase [Erythrobacter sp.]
MTPLAFRFAAALALALPAVPIAAAQDSLDWSAPERELRVSVEGGEVWVRVDGNLEAAAEPAIFVHGGPGGTHMTFGNLISLADERAIILYDQLDSGKSDRPGDQANWRVERFVGELEAIRKALGVERWHVVGHSWGAALALEYAAAYPQHTASAVLGGTYISTPHWITGTNLLIRDLPDEVGATLSACESPAPPPPTRCREATRAFYAAYNGRADRPEPSEQARAYRRRYGGKGFNEALYNAMWGPSEFRATGSLVDYNATPLLSRIDGERVLFMVGQYDEARLDTVQDFVALTPGSELAVIPGGSHAFPTERPDVTEAVLRDWLARIDARDALESKEPGQ